MAFKLLMCKIITICYHFLFIRKNSSNKSTAELATIANRDALSQVNQQSNQAENQHKVQMNVYEYPVTNDSLTIQNNNTSTVDHFEMQKVQQ